MIADVYTATHPTHAVQDAMCKTRVALNIKEQWLDTKGNPQPEDGVRYDDNVMKGVQYVVDEGSVQYLDKGPLARSLADTLGYVSASNCTAMVRECIKNGLLSAHMDGSVGVLAHTEYGREQLARWERFKDE